MFYSSELLSVLHSLYVTVTLRNSLVDLTYMWNLKKLSNRLINTERGPQRGWGALCEQGNMAQGVATGTYSEAKETQSGRLWSLPVVPAGPRKCPGEGRSAPVLYTWNHHKMALNGNGSQERFCLFKKDNCYFLIKHFYIIKKIRPVVKIFQILLFYYYFLGEHTMQYTDNVLHNYTLETYIIVLTNVTPINSIKNKRKIK